MKFEVHFGCCFYCNVLLPALLFTIRSLPSTRPSRTRRRRSSSAARTRSSPNASSTGRTSSSWPTRRHSPPAARPAPAWRAWRAPTRRGSSLRRATASSPCRSSRSAAASQRRQQARPQLLRMASPCLLLLLLRWRAAVARPICWPPRSTCRSRPHRSTRARPCRPFTAAVASRQPARPLAIMRRRQWQSAHWQSSKRPNYTRRPTSRWSTPSQVNDQIILPTCNCKWNIFCIMYYLVC